MKTVNPNLSESYKYLLRLLSSVLNNTQPPKPNPNTDWASVFYVASLHSVVGMVCYALDRMNKEDLPPKELYIQFKEIQQSELILESNIEFETENLIKEFNKSKLRTVMLKGMILKHYYPVPSMRTMSDVDILYREEDKKEIMRIFKEKGYMLTLDFDSELNFNKPPFHHYEMHASLLQASEKSHEFFLNVWDRTEENSKGNFRALNLEYTYLYMLEHLAKHIEKAGAGLRMIMDFYVFLQKEKHNLNEDIVSEGLKELKLTEFAQKINNIAYNWFAGDNPDTESLISRFILYSSTFGLSKNAILQQNIRKEYNTGKKQNGFKYILRKIFPDYMHICARFPSAKKLKVLYPFYIPAFWCLRIFKDKNINTSNIGNYFIKTDSQEALFLMNAIKGLGLESRM